MILIFTRAGDPAANGVIPWLVRAGREVVRINQDEDGTADLRLTARDAEIVVAGRRFALADLDAVWFRKGDFWFGAPAPAIDLPEAPALAAKLASRRLDEERVAAEYFHHLLRAAGVRVLGNPSLAQPNKLVMLHHAASLGLAIPPFEVVRRLSARHRAHPADYITKSLSDGIYLWDFEGSGRGYFSYTESLADVPGLAAASGAIPTSLIQRRVDKAFEVRAFYLDGQFFSAAILSQRDAQTQIDYRKYNYARPNRNVPVALPPEVEQRLATLFARIGLNTGSVDLIVDAHGEHIFLEINPTGQWGAVADVCNYDIDARIARWLLQEGPDARSGSLSADAAAA